METFNTEAALHCCIGRTYISKRSDLPMPKKIIILTPFYCQIGGAETFARELYRQSNKRHKTYVCKINWRKIWRGINWQDSFQVLVKLFLLP